MNVNKLKGKMAENGVSVANLADFLKKDRSTVYRKLEDGKFTVAEATAMKDYLGMTNEEARVIFLD
jgi:predicted transcriptional regulator